MMLWDLNGIAQYVEKREGLVNIRKARKQAATKPTTAFSAAANGTSTESVLAGARLIIKFVLAKYTKNGYNVNNI